MSTISNKEMQPLVGAVEQPPSRRARVMMSITCFFVFVMVYVVSAGPMVWIHDHFQVKVFQRSLEILYAPLAFIVKTDLWPFAPILKWYVGLFR